MTKSYMPRPNWEETAKFARSEVERLSAELSEAIRQRDAALALAEKAEAALAGARDAALEEAAGIADRQADDDRQLLKKGIINRESAGIAILTSHQNATAIRAARTVEPRHD